jgi:hypothetical protein
MSKPQRNKVRRKLRKTTPAKQRSWLSPLFFLTAAVVVLVVFISWRFNSLSVPFVSRPVKESSLVGPAAAENRSEFQKLKGRWRRPDGGYIVAINSIAESGAVDAAYFNPYPIHVGNAVVSRDSGRTKVFVELRDVNYPGSTYTLTYEPSSDQLQGIYYQAVEQQRFQVIFERMK